MQKVLTDQMMNLIIKELHERNMGNGSLHASRIIQSIEQSNKGLKQTYSNNSYYIIYVDQATQQILIHYKI